METALVSLSVIELPASAAGATVPDWIHLMPKGRVQARDGRGPWHYEDAKAVIEESFARHRRIHVDENHSTITAGKLGMSAPARGYITEMEEREDGIWGKVDWTQTGEALLSDRAYWGISPVLSYDKRTGKVLAIAHASLTNDPALRELLALNSTEYTDMFSAKVAKLLGLSEDTSEDDILAAMTSRLTKGGEGEEMLSTSLAQIGTAMGLEGEVSLSTLVTTAAAFKAARSEQTEAFAALQTEVRELKDASKRKAAEAFVDNAIRERRQGVKPEREKWVALHMERPEWVEGMIGSFSKLDQTHTRHEPPAQSEGVVSLSTEHRQVARQLGLSDDEMIAALKADQQEDF